MEQVSLKNREHGRKRKRSNKTEQMRLSIKEASLNLFLEQGYEKTTTRQILQKVGILNGSLYNIYKGKEDIFSDIVLDALTEISRQAPKFVQDTTDHVSMLKFILCTEIYIARCNGRLAELISLTSSNWEIHRKTYESMQGMLEDVSGSDLSLVMSRLDVCLGAASSMVLRLVNLPETFDCRDGMVIIAEMVDALFGMGVRDEGLYVDELIAGISSKGITVCGITVNFPSP